MTGGRLKHGLLIAIAAILAIGVAGAIALHFAAQALKDRVEQALGPESEVGAITVATNQPGAEIYVDSKSVGTAPLTSEIYVNVGTHVLSARQGSAVTPGKTIDALAGRTYEVDLELERASAAKTL